MSSCKVVSGEVGRLLNLPIQKLHAVRMPRHPAPVRWYTAICAWLAEFAPAEARRVPCCLVLVLYWTASTTTMSYLTDWTTDKAININAHWSRPHDLSTNCVRRRGHFKRSLLQSVHWLPIRMQVILKKCTCAFKIITHVSTRTTSALR